MGIDLVGSGNKIVALVEADDKSGKTAREIAEEIIRTNKNIKTVLEKFPGTTGKFRMKSYRFVLGDKDTEVVHKEHGYVLKLDPQKVYFSPRESTVRQKVSAQVKPKEKVLVMFAGAGPYPVSIARAQPKVGEVVGIDLNPEAVGYMKENVRINKVSHLVTPVWGDVREYCEKSEDKFDRIIMPMIEAKEFLGSAVKCAKKSAVICLYMVSKRENLFKDCEDILNEEFKKIGVTHEIKSAQKISLYAPGKWKVLMEIRLK